MLVDCVALLVVEAVISHLLLSPVDSLKAALDNALESAIKGHFGEIKALLSAYKDSRGDVSLSAVLNYQHSKTQASVLMCAAARGELGLTRSLLSAGADVTLKAKDESNALEWACKFNEVGAVTVLAKAGAVLSEDFAWEDCSEEVIQELHKNGLNVSPNQKLTKEPAKQAGQSSSAQDEIEYMTDRIKNLLQGGSK